MKLYLKKYTLQSDESIDMKEIWLYKLTEKKWHDLKKIDAQKMFLESLRVVPSHVA